MCDDRYRDLAAVLDQALAADGIVLYAAHVVDKVAPVGPGTAPTVVANRVGG